MQKLYNDAMEMINLLSSKKDFLNENEVVQLTRANNIVTFFERLFLHTHVDIIKEAIYNIFIDKIEKAIESNNNELKNLNIQLQTIIAQRDSYKRRLENNDELAEQTNIKKKKIITNHQYIDGKIKFLNMKRLALQQEIDFIQEFKSKNEHIKQKFIYNPTDFISDFIRETYLDVDSFLANQLLLNLKEVNNVIGDIVLHPGYDSKKKQNSLINKDKLNVILMKLVIDYMQNEDTILLQTVKENWQLEIEITKSHIAIDALSSLLVYFQGGQFESENKQLIKLKQQKRELYFSCNHLQKEAIEQSIIEIEKKFFKFYDCWGESNLLQNTKFLSLIGISKNDVSSSNTEKESYLDDIISDNYLFFDSSTTKENVRYNLIAIFKKQPQLFFEKIQSLIDEYQDKLKNMKTKLDNNRKNVPDSNFVQYSDLSNIHCYYQMVDKNKHITEILQCIDILQTFLNLVTFMKSGQEIIYSQEHIDLIINSVLNNMINQIVYSEEYGTDYSEKAIVKKLTFNENNM